MFEKAQVLCVFFKSIKKGRELKMTLHSFQEHMEDFDKKRIKVFLIKMALMVLLTAVGLSLFISIIVNATIGIVILGLAFLVYLFILDASAESEKTFEFLEHVSVFWWIGILFLVLGVVAYLFL